MNRLIWLSFSKRKALGFPLSESGFTELKDLQDMINYFLPYKLDGALLLFYQTISQIIIHNAQQSEFLSPAKILFTRFIETSYYTLF